MLWLGLLDLPCATFLETLRCFKLNLGECLGEKRTGNVWRQSSSNHVMRGMTYESFSFLMLDISGDQKAKSVGMN
ncbi:hypothetical protein ACLB6G_14345 [Zhengella sp. ZM62]|uniref:hypothetical protein n=1 Tax=Zhengella sedimenti TaxID=3390035 RepID=UPI003975A37B